MPRTEIHRYHFRGVQNIPAAGSGHAAPWVKTITGAAPPTCKGASLGALELALTADAQAQNVCLSFNDVLSYDIDDLIRVECIAKLSTASLAAEVMAAIGVAGARHDTIDSIAQAALFRVIGNNTLVVETDDGTSDNDDVATGDILSTSYKRLVIDFASGSKSQSPPALSLGGKANVQFAVGNPNGHLRRVARNTSFDMSAYSSGLQLYAQIQKTSSASVGTLSILGFEVEVKLSA